MTSIIRSRVPKGLAQSAAGVLVCAALLSCVLVPGFLAAARAADSGPDSKRVLAIAEMLAPEPRGVGRPAADRSAWEAARRLPGLAGIVQRAKTLVAEPMPELTEELYLDFSRTGNRTRCQKVIFARHGRIPTLVIAECLENRGQFLPALEAAIRAICAEPSWLLPAHDGALRNYRGQTVEIDLVSAATSWELATARYWLSDKLNPEVSQLIRSELERRTFAPFEGYARRGEPRLWWPAGTNNWNAVCLAGVTGAALAAIEEPQRRAWFVAAAEKYVQNFLKGFTPDGYCSEGIGYYNYGFGNYVLLSETIWQATGGRVDLMEPPLVRQIATFGPRMEILPGLYPAFADCSPHARPDTQLLAYLSRRYGCGWSDIEKRAAAGAGDSASLFGLGIYGLPHSVSQKPAAAPPKAVAALRDWFADAGILICRPRPGVHRALGVALKGGHNAEHHNHNDLGSFVVAVDGETPLLDPGAEVYTARTFSGRRYESKVLNSYGHPVPLVAGTLQRTGRQAAAQVVRTDFTDGQDTIVFDLRSAYPVKTLKRLQRTFVFSREGSGSLTVADEVEFAEPQTFGTALITYSPDRQLQDSRILVGRGAAAVQIDVAAEGVPFTIRSEELQEDVHGPHQPVRLGIDVTQPVERAKVTVTVRSPP